MHPTEGPHHPRGAHKELWKSTAQLATGIIHPLHLLFSASHFFFFYSSFSRKISGYLTGSSQTSSFSPALSLQSWRETPSPSDRIGQPALPHHCAERLKTRFTRWLGLACVITFEWGLGAGSLPCRSCVVFSKGELRARELLRSGEKRRDSFSAATRKAVFSGKVKDIERASLSLSQHTFEWNASTAHLSNPVAALLSRRLLHAWHSLVLGCLYRTDPPQALLSKV